MTLEHKFIFADDDDPRRCTSGTKYGQCKFLSMPGHNVCIRHGGRNLAAEKKQMAEQYRLQRWNQRISEFAEHEKVKTLRDEIGVLRMVLEATLNRCEDTAQLLMFNTQIADLVMKLEKLVSSCDRLEGKMGMYLDKAAALNFAGQIVDIVARYVDDPEVTETISEELIEALGKLTTARGREGKDE